MRPLTLVPYYFYWHYSQGLKNILAITNNLVWFFWHFFSIGLLSRTLFLPWQKIQEERPQHTIDLGPILGTLVINALMRFAGGLIRLFFICIGLLTITGTLAFGAFVFFIWLIFPAFLIFTFILGLALVFKPV